MSFTEKEKEIFNKGLKINREEKEKFIHGFYERIEKELEVSTEEYKNIIKAFIPVIVLIS